MPGEESHVPSLAREDVVNLLKALDIPEPVLFCTPKIGRFQSFHELEFRSSISWRNIKLPEKLALRTSIMDTGLSSNISSGGHTLVLDSAGKERCRNEIACAMYAKCTGLGTTIYAFSATAQNPLKVPYVLMEVAPGKRLNDQLLDLSLAQLHAFSEAFVSLMASCEYHLKSSGQIVAAPELPDEDEPYAWTFEKLQTCFTVQPISVVSEASGSTASTLQTSKIHDPAVCSSSSLVGQLREKTQRLKYDIPVRSWELYEDEFTSLEEAFDFFDTLRPSDPEVSTFPWHRDMFAYNVIVHWEDDVVPKINIIDWDGVYTAPAKRGVASPADIMLAYQPFANSRSSEEMQELHEHALDLLKYVFPGFWCADLAMNHALATIDTILEGEFYDGERLYLFIEFGKDWKPWKRSMCQGTYCSLQSPPPAFGFWDSRDDSSTSGHSSGDKDSLAVGSTVIQDDVSC